MFSRSIGFVVSIAVLWFPLSSFALGLGDLTVESRLASPLNARVVVNGIDRVNIDPELLIIKLDSKISASTPMLFHRLERSGNDSTAIIIYTRTAVMEPLFEFRLLVEWENGSIARNYDVLIDPPSYELETAASSVVPSQVNQASIAEDQISAVESASTTTDSTLLPKLPDENDGLATVASKSSINKGQTYGPTVSGNSLWRVARNVKSGNESLSMYQWMHGIWGENPDAFTGLNMHRLRVNALLSIPLEQDVFKISHKLAYQLYAEHLAILQSAQAEKSKLAVNTVVVEAEQPLLEPGQTLAVEVLQENIEEEVAAEVSSASVEAVVPENSQPVTEAIGAPDQNEVIYDLLAIAEIEGQQSAEAELIETAKNSDDIDNLAQGDDLVTGTAQADDLIQAVVSITAETPVSGNVADSEVSDSAGSNDAFGFIANSVRGLGDRVSSAPSWVSMILGAMLMLLFVGLVRMLRNNAEPVGSDPVRADIIAQRRAVEAEESSTLLSDIDADITQAREDLSGADEPAVGAVVDVKKLLVEADVLVAYGNTEAVEIRSELEEIDWGISEKTSDDSQPVSDSSDSQKPAKITSDDEQPSEGSNVGALEDSEIIADAIEQIDVVEPTSQINMSEDTLEFFGFADDEPELELRDTDDSDVETIESAYAADAEIDNTADTALIDQLKSEADTVDMEARTSEIEILDYDDSNADRTVEVDQTAATNDEDLSEEVGDTLSFIEEVYSSSELPDEVPGSAETPADAEIDNTADTALIDRLKSEADTVDMEARTSEIEILDYDDSNADRTVEVYQTAATNDEDLSEEVGDTLSFIEEVDSSSELPDEVPGSAETPADVDGEELAEKGTDPYLRPVNGHVFYLPEGANQEEDKANEFEAQLMHTLQAMRDQMQQMNERLFSQERENQRLRKALEDLNSDAFIDKRDKA